MENRKNMNIGVNSIPKELNTVAGKTTEVMSLDQLMSGRVAPKATALSPTSTTAAPIFSEAELQFFSAFTQKITDGTVRTRKEISVILKEMASATPIKGYKLTQAKMDALKSAIDTIDNTPGKDNSSLRNSLLDEFKSLMRIRKLHRQISQRILNPTMENGGLDLFGNPRKEWFKHL
ncbi:MAG: hypothetical protein K0R08_2235 [Solimicrobium sp.]|jgi:hypothetical protein|nr:hypothetical protein [Solimicrobium sp.]